jgi:hypothetical protein
MITPIPSTQLPGARNRLRCWDVDVVAKQTKEPTFGSLLKATVLVAGRESDNLDLISVLSYVVKVVIVGCVRLGEQKRGARDRMALNGRSLLAGLSKSERNVIRSSFDLLGQSSCW